MFIDLCIIHTLWAQAMLWQLSVDLYLIVLYRLTRMPMALWAKLYHNCSNVYCSSLFSLNVPSIRLVWAFSSFIHSFNFSIFVLCLHVCTNVIKQRKKNNQIISTEFSSPLSLPLSFYIKGNMMIIYSYLAVKQSQEDEIFVNCICILFDGDTSWQ